ncbi:MAG: tryptophan halogenase family protein [Steroidobacteraceae bacterium]
MSETEQRAARRLRSIVIVGGGTAGWMAAAAFSRVLAGSQCEITLVESDAIGTVGVGEATIPSLLAFHGLLGIDEREFLRATGATFKLALRFRDWGRMGETFLHPFGPYGVDANHELFQAYWLKRRSEGSPSPLEEWSVTGLAARSARVGAPTASGPSALRYLSYAYHLDATLYARFLRTYAEKRGVRRMEGEVVDVTVGQRDLIESLQLRDGRSIRGDFFIDCSGFRALAIAKALQIGYVDWSHWLLCDRAVATQCESVGALVPLTQLTAREAGWQWRIPLQHRVGNGYAYSSAHLSDDEAAATLVAHLEAAPLSEPRLLHFKAGRRAQAWVGNCLALGLAAGFLEPLESTSIHLIQTGIGRLFALFPDRDFDPAVSAEYNRLTALEYERVRDFLLLHYAASRRDDAPFWRHCRAMSLPATLQYKWDLFRTTGRIAMLDEESFKPANWLAIYTGMGVWPQRHEPVVDLLAPAATARLEAMREAVRAAVETLPAHATYLQEVANGG